METGDVIATVKRSDEEEFKIMRREYKGVRYIDIRLWCKFEGQDDWRPTKKGVTMKAEIFEEFKKAIAEVEI